jgi:hypothetical protein
VIGFHDWSEDPAECEHRECADTCTDTFADDFRVVATEIASAITIGVHLRRVVPRSLMELARTWSQAAYADELPLSTGEEADGLVALHLPGNAPTGPDRY